MRKLSSKLTVTVKTRKNHNLGTSLSQIPFFCQGAAVSNPWCLVPTSLSELGDSKGSGTV